MIERILTHLRRAGLPLIWLGIVCQTGYLLGYFHHGDRLALYSSLNDEREVTVEMNVMGELMERFEASVRDPSGFDRLRVNGKSPQSIVRAVNRDGGLVSLATLEQLHWWAFEPDDSFTWSALIAIVLGAAIETRQRVRA